MEQGNYGENFDRGYEEQARPRQQVIVIGEPVPDKRLQGLLQEYSEYYCRYCLFWCMLLRYLLYNTGIG